MIFPPTVEEAIRSGIEEYTGRTLRTLSVHPDPVVAETYAARAVMADDGATVDFLLVGGGMRRGLRLSSAEEVADALEECEFGEWPPAAGRVRFDWRVAR